MTEKQRPFCSLVKGKASIYIPSQLANVKTRMKRAEIDRKKLILEFWLQNFGPKIILHMSERLQHNPLFYFS